MTVNTSLAARVRAWIEADPDPATRRELEELLADGDEVTLADRMEGDLEFGTAGLRGAVEAGSNRMNRAVIIRTTAGLGRFLAGREGPVVLGFDGRTSSRTFADDTAAVLAAAGRPVRYFSEPVPTPLVAFAARRLGTVAAVVITASHNPPADNGYKVYDANAAQIVPPADVAIATEIGRVGPACHVPRIDGALAGESDLVRPLDSEEIYEAYRREVDGVRTGRPRSTVTMAYTPIHGVGWSVLERLFTDGGHRSVAVVPEQRDPDGRFPTVSFPNPEEPGAMDLVMELGSRIGADLVLANDPDADRLAVALPVDGHWQPLTGNQVGVLLADWLLEHWSESERPIVVNSIVSSPMLAEVASNHGAHFEQTLTGFKWISNAALELEWRGVGRFAFGYEEALGYSVGGVVRDKDGLSAALVFADMAAELQAQGSSVAERLASLYQRVGLWVSTQRSIVRPGTQGLADIAAAMDRLGDETPTSLGSRSVIFSVDYRTGSERRPRWLGTTPLMELGVDGGGRVLVRPSGTEPKLKIYVDLPGQAVSEDALRAEAEELAAATAAHLGL